MSEESASTRFVDAFVAELDDIATRTGATIQAFDARYVVSERHVERAVELADRAIDRGENIARDRAVEILLYVAGRRQITDALELGVSTGNTRVVVLVDGGETTTAVDLVGDRVLDERAATLGDYDRKRVKAYYDVDDAELAVVDDDLESLVLERVALLVVEK